MGQGKNNQDLRAGQHARSIKGTSVSRKLTALGSAGLILGGIAFCSSSGFAHPANLSSKTQKAVEANPKFDSQVAWKHLLTQVAFGPRKPGTERHKDCRDYIQAELKKTCENVRLQPFEHKWSSNGQVIKMWNVIGEQNWKDAEVRVALFAHWDTRPTADQEQDPVKRTLPIPGANDGASGVAVLLELARALKVSPAKVGIMYVFVDGEDLGPGLDEMFLGARAFAAAMPSQKPEYGILLDMIGDKDLSVPKEPNSIRYAPTLVKALYQHAFDENLQGSFPKTLGPEIEDDHIPLNEAGLPTIDLIDFSYDPWHTLSDTPDKCSAASLGKVGHLLETWLRKAKPFRIKDE